MNPPSAISVSAWIKVAQGRNNCGIVSKFGADNAMLEQWVLWEGLPDGVNQGFYAGICATASQTGNLRANYVTPQVDGQWHQLMLTYDGSILLLYADGSIVSSAAGGLGTLAVYAQAVEIGRYYHGLNNGGQNYYYSGLTDEVRIYNVALSSNEVGQLYAYEAGTNPPTITVKPQPVTVNAYGNASFGVTAVGTPPLNYQWSLNGTNILGATSSSLTISNVVQTNLGIYAVVVTNAFGSVTSSNAPLSMYPFIRNPFNGIVINWGQNATLNVQAWGTGPLSYQWFDNGVAVQGATNQSLTLASIQFTNAGLYSVVVSSSLVSVAHSTTRQTLS